MSFLIVQTQQLSFSIVSDSPISYIGRALQLVLFTTFTAPSSYIAWIKNSYSRVVSSLSVPIRHLVGKVKENLHYLLM